MTRRSKLSLTIFSLIIIFLIPQVISLAGAQVAGTANSWVSKASLPMAGSDYGAASVNGIIYVLGSSVNYAYNPNTNSWSQKTPMPVPRTEFAIAACNNKIYVIGGVDSNGSSSSVNEAYDPSTDTWTTKAALPTSRSEMQAGTINGKIYVMGGRTAGAYSTVNITEIYDPAANSWSSGVSMLYPVVGYASAVVDNKIYVIGGQDEYLSSASNNVAFAQIYDPATNAWSLGASMPVSTWQVAAGATTGTMAPKQIYVIGGMTGFGEGSNQTYAYDPSANTWTTAASIPFACYNPAIAVVNDVLYVIGGSQSTVALSTNEQYTPIGYNQTSSSPSPSSQSSDQSTKQTLLIEYIGLIAVIIAIIAVATAYILKKRTKTIKNNDSKAVKRK